MTYFSCLTVGSWMFAVGWFLGVIHVQNHTEVQNDEPQIGPSLTEAPFSASNDPAYYER
jgi:hypothetical protein